MEVTIDLVNPLKSESQPDIGDSNLEQFRNPLMDWSAMTNWSRLEEVSIRPGLKLYIENVRHPVSSYQFSIDRPPLEMSVLLSGENCGSLKDSRGFQKTYQIDSGSSVITYMPKSIGIDEHKDQPLIAVGIHIDPDLMNGLLGIHDEFLPGPFLDIINGVEGQSYCHFCNLNRQLREVAIEMLNCRLTGNLRRLFLEGKVIEMIALQMDLLHRQTESRDPSYTRSDNEKIYAARDLLTMTCQTPPTLFEIARSVGLSHTRLNRGFRQVFGKTVFEYLRHFRLEKARLLLLETDLKIIDIAYEVGFSDSSHFSRLFYKAYGIQPSVFRLVS